MITPHRSWKISHVISLLVVGAAVAFGAVSAAASANQPLMSADR